MPSISNDEVEALARQLLWEQIDRSAWFSGMSEEKRTAAIEADVEQWWHLRAEEAARILVNRFIAGHPLSGGNTHPDRSRLSTAVSASHPARRHSAG